jgi:hypothetical protein
MLVGAKGGMVANFVNCPVNGILAASSTGPGEEWNLAPEDFFEPLFCASQVGADPQLMFLRSFPGARSTNLEGYPVKLFTPIVVGEKIGATIAFNMLIEFLCKLATS